MLLVLGLVLGWLAASVHPAPLVAGGGDRSGESIVATGPVMIRYDEGSKVQIPLEALYLLDYKAGKLVGTIPSMQQTTKGSKYLGVMAERDLAPDFKLDLDNGPRPRFLMTTGALGAYSGGWAPLYVVETTTNQVGVYRIVQQSVGTKTSSRFELLEMRALASAPPTAGRPPG
jgi:hypothetical protein